MSDATASSGPDHELASAWTTRSIRASRAIGAMFFTIFGGAWLGLAARARYDEPLTAYVVIAIVTLILTGFAYARYRRYAVPATTHNESPDERRRSRNFHIINAAQWVLILVVGNLLVNLGLPDWVIPAAMLVVGLHFVPLAIVFRNPPHFVTGIALMTIAAVYPFVADGGAKSPVGCLGAGLVLWLSALWAVTAHPAIERAAIDQDARPAV
jgi:hypothetical protein